jgi:hypothetical protein
MVAIWVSDFRIPPVLDGVRHGRNPLIAFTTHILSPMIERSLHYSFAWDLAEGGSLGVFPNE